jgi:hypothetical protein
MKMLTFSSVRRRNIGPAQLRRREQHSLRTEQSKWDVNHEGHNSDDCIDDNVACYKAVGSLKWFGVCFDRLVH